ncbi:hypothetical protein DACRYDRAFT_118701 [Dacryopinax primogenitus]|uniref:F-box domain-containing protein n=1 Tax=Dacryopinax primogenitus (strain DJM 731) TaxID=1858805 RepID=M5G3T5_DACPD|nr:uncharacterized protein DACRYDRAFT_118701 [Dacryopinax primogenitus]EJT98422.1 hypothetical protein DACRYDRAFT_118701 [Dacryopinax primogenitus]
MHRVRAHNLSWIEMSLSHGGCSEDDESVLREPPALPVELWDLILSFTSRADLRTISFLSRAFHTLAQRHLYRHLSLRLGLPTVQQCVLISRRPELALSVRSISLLFGLEAADRAGASRTRTYARPPRELFAPAYTRLFFRTYAACSRLAQLSVSSHLGFDDLLTSNLFLSPKHKITYFQVGARGPQGSILHSLPYLRSLYMLNLFGCNTDSLSPSALPRLQAVRCSLRQAETLIPGRPVRDVALEATTLDLDHLPRVIRTLQMSTAPIRALDLKLRSFDPSTFRLVGTAFPCLREFVLTVLDVPYRGIFDLAPEDWLAQGHLSPLRQLRTLELHAFYAPPSHMLSFPLLPLLTGLSSSLPHLSRVSIVDRGSTHAHEALVRSYDARLLPTPSPDERERARWDLQVQFRNCRNRRSMLFKGFGDLGEEEPVECVLGERMPGPQCWVM